MTASDFAIGNATERDLESMAAFTLESGHGVLDLMFGGLIPGRSISDILIERRFTNPASFAHLNHWRVARLIGGAVVGAVCALPFDLYQSLPADPLIGPERLRPLEPLIDLEKGLAGQFCITNLATDPAFRGRGIGRALIEHVAVEASAAGFSQIGLSTFGDDAAIMAFYRSAGFREIGRAAMIDHSLIRATGNWVLLSRRIHRAE